MTDIVGAPEGHDNSDIHGSRSSGEGWCAINADSHEELFDFVHAYPASAVLTYEVTPPFDWEHAYNSIIPRLSS